MVYPAHYLITVSAANGFIYAIVTIIWFDDITLGILIGVAIVINLIATAMTGVGIPLILNKFGIDPALAGSVLLITATDVVGFMAFPGFATLYIV